MDREYQTGAEDERGEVRLVVSVAGLAGCRPEWGRFTHCGPDPPTPTDARPGDDACGLTAAVQVGLPYRASLVLTSRGGLLSTAPRAGLRPRCLAGDVMMGRAGVLPSRWPRRCARPEKEAQ